MGIRDHVGWAMRLFIGILMLAGIWRAVEAYVGVCADTGRILSEDELCFAAAKESLLNHNVRNDIMDYATIDEFKKLNPRYCVPNPVLPEGLPPINFFSRLLGWRMIVLTKYKELSPDGGINVQSEYYVSNCGVVSSD